MNPNLSSQKPKKSHSTKNIDEIELETRIREAQKIAESQLEHPITNQGNPDHLEIKEVSPKENSQGYPEEISSNSPKLNTFSSESQSYSNQANISFNQNRVFEEDEVSQIDNIGLFLTRQSPTESYSDIRKLD